jgi:fused signal recognition particle receptor
MQTRDKKRIFIDVWARWRISEPEKFFEAVRTEQNGHKVLDDLVDAAVRDVVAKKLPGAPHEVLLVVDATTGQNAINQAKAFQKAIDVSGIFLAKLDGTAKGGIVVAIRNEVDLPVKFVGLGETYEDVEPFDPERFVEALFA